MNVIFLDIDGVLNSKTGATFDDKYCFSKSLVLNLKSILESVPETKIVITSFWKNSIYNEALSNTVPWRNILINKLNFNQINDIIIGETPNIKNNKGEEIKFWLNKNKDVLKINNFVIIDSNTQNISNNFPNTVVKINSEIGLQESNAKEAIWILTKFGRDKPMQPNTYFISDTHFYHGNIINYCNRPFSSIEEMNNQLIENWNSIVKPTDIVYHLGDFSFGGKENLLTIKPKLNGRINIVLGNHDKYKTKFYYDVGFNRVYDKPILINGFYILSHEPLEFLNSNSCFYNIFGHVHDNDCYKTWSSNGCCVCVERHNYKPVSWSEIQNKIKQNDE